ncbi:MAG TPA: SCP2 sterol-binding domain-containing protein [Thermoplasmata archaeon]|nr:SCP2 sterol-binding domain-containing protein [Thermoplasmata archaeon]
MAKFPSEEWLAAYVAKLNTNPNYEDAARKWEGAMTFVILKDAAFDKDAYLFLDLFHGKCRGSKFSLKLEDLPPAQYKYMGPFTNWKRLINKEIDPIQGILTGKFKLEGSMMTIMRFTRAAKEMVATTTMVQTEF